MLRRFGNFDNMNIDTSVQKPSRFSKAGQVKNIFRIKGCGRNGMSDLTGKVKGRHFHLFENDAVITSTLIDESLKQLTPQNIEGGQL
jgi:hypothetical protein